MRGISGRNPAIHSRERPAAAERYFLVRSRFSVTERDHPDSTHLGTLKFAEGEEIPAKYVEESWDVLADKVICHTAEGQRLDGVPPGLNDETVEAYEDWKEQEFGETELFDGDGDTDDE